MNGRTIVTIIVAAGAAFALLMMWWAREVGFPKHPPVGPAPASLAASAAPASAVPLATATPVPAATPAAVGTHCGRRARRNHPAKAGEHHEGRARAAKAQHRALRARDRALGQGKARRALGRPRENTLRLALEHDKVEVTPDQLECRATLCRLALHLPILCPTRAR